MIRFYMAPFKLHWFKGVWVVKIGTLAKTVSSGTGYIKLLKNRKSKRKLKGHFHDYPCDSEVFMHSQIKATSWPLFASSGSPLCYRRQAKAIPNKVLSDIPPRSEPIRILSAASLPSCAHLFRFIPSLKCFLLAKCSVLTKAVRGRVAFILDA